MNTSSLVLPIALDLIKKQCQSTVFTVLSQTSSRPEFANNKALMSQVSGMKNAFSDQLNNDFSRLINELEMTASRGIIGEVQHQIRELAMVDQEELAFKIKEEEFIERTHKGHGIAQALLVMRFESVLGRDLEEEQLPLAAEKLIHALQQAVRPIDLDREEKTAFFSHLSNTLHRFYGRYLSDANNIFIDQNILADLNESDGRSRYKKRQQRLQAGKKRKALIGSITDNLQTDENGNPILPKMNDLLSQLHIPDSCIEHQLPEIIGGSEIAMSELLTAIDELQQGKESELPSTYRLLQSNQPLAKQLQQGRLSDYNLSASDANTISMMSMLFEDLLSNQHMAEPIKAILEQLQGPLLKTALLDKEFFADSGNPAQLLLDIITDQGASWAPDKNPEKDFLYQKLSNTVEQVKTNFDGSYEVFEKSVPELKQFYKKHQQRIEKIEARIVTAEKSKARFNRAHEESNKHISKVFGDFELPQNLEKFIQKQWQHVLFFIHNKYDTSDNKEWRKALATEVLLSECLNGISSADSKKSVLALQQMMLQIGQDKVDVNTVLKKIFTEVKPALKKTVVTEAVENIENKTSVDDIADVTTEATSDMVFDSVDDVITDDVESTASDSLTQQQLLKLQDVLTVGSWLLDESGEEKQKVKVAAYIKHTDTYILVHRNGTRYASLHSNDIFLRIKKGDLSVLESAMMFDKALESVITSIRTA